MEQVNLDNPGPRGLEASIPMESPAEEQMTPIQDVDAFAMMIMAWHGSIVAQLSQLFEIPDGITATLTGEDGGDITIELEGPTRQAFHACAAAALGIVGHLPFGLMEVEPEVAAETPAADEPAAG